MPTFVASSGALTHSSNASFTVSHTIAAGDDRLLLGAASWRSSPTMDDMTYDGVSLTEVIAVDTGDGFGDIKQTLRRLIAPNVGTADFVSTLTEATRHAAGCYNFTGVHQTTPLGTAAENGNNGVGSIAVTADSAEGDLIASVCGWNGGGTDADQTSDGDDRFATTGPGTQKRMNVTGATKAGAATETTVNWTSTETGGRLHAFAVALKPAGEPSGFKPWFARYANIGIGYDDDF